MSERTKIEREGAYMGLNYTVVATYMGHRCGYVYVPGVLSLSKEERERIEYGIDCHGGVTYLEQKGDELCIGFDCAHLYDVVYHSIMSAECARFSAYREGGIVWTADMVEEDCRKIIAQIIPLSLPQVTAKEIA